MLIMPIFALSLHRKFISELRFRLITDGLLVKVDRLFFCVLESVFPKNSKIFIEYLQVLSFFYKFAVAKVLFFLKLSKQITINRNEISKNDGRTGC